MQIVPLIEPHVINKCVRRLWEAERMLRELLDLQQSPIPDTFEETWLKFLVALNSVVEILKTGTKRNPKARQWFGAKEKVIRGDPLLSYLLHSRGADFHGERRLFELRLSHGTYEYQTYDLANEPPANQGVFNIPPEINQISLWYEPQPVFDQHGNRFDPPTSHLGGPLQTAWPTALGYTALYFYRDLVQQAEQLG